ncbi:uncharacterized protein J4E78_003301 [Alternaria triticimaculans]|uniref:uncharacterized protein n=1 Tax=Alternaria triticimaculans TaxID=297637 RepID=UPI0020C3A787|nr:uncharacterized protein J4E78_003301 [Alternaria triticimaculans]KAI4665836.1 hypothetical protein J4E78_003301 [Alternaria triticimaculans]
MGHFPGPKFSAFTRLPYLTAIVIGELPRHVAQLHAQYGEVVRLSPDELSFTNPKAWRDIYGYGSKEGPGSAPPKNWNRRGSSPDGANSLVAEQDNAEHARIRKIFSPAFSDRALVQQSPLFIKYADQLVRNLRESVQANAVDLVRMYNFTTFDVMADLTFGESLHLLDNAEYNTWIQVIFRSIKGGTLMSIFFYYPLAKFILFTLLGKTIATFRREHHNYTVERVTKRLEKGRVSEGVDLWDLVLQQEDKGKPGLTRPVMDMNGELFMLAGTETTATLLSGLTYLLLVHSESMAKLVEEIRTAFNSSDDITSHLAMYSSPNNFRLPESFIPERWLGDPRFTSDERSALQPFHVGPRDCLGKNMALHEMRLIMSKVLFNFDLELLPECRNWIADQKIYSLWEKTPLMVKIKDAVPDVDMYEDVVQLTTPLQLQPPVSIYIKSDSPYRVTLIKGNSVDVDAGPESFTKITSLRPLIIASSAPLKSAFAEGWNKLPAELKILTLEFNMKAENRVGAGNKCVYPPIVYCRLLPHLAMTREIGAIARDIFWTKNEFHLEPAYYSVIPGNGSLDARLYFAYPPQAFHHLIRRLAVRIRPMRDEWLKLAKLANGDYGFAALRNVVVELDMRVVQFTRARRYDDFLTNTVGDGIDFHCAGNLKFLAPQKAKGRSSEVSFEDVKKMFNSRIRFAVEETKAEG